jgi:acetyl esterase
MAAPSSTTASVAGQLERSTQALIDSLADAQPLYTLSPEAARAVLTSAQKSVPVKLAPASVEDRVLHVGPTGRTNIRVYRPAAARGALPAVFYTHGGGWVLGDRETHDRLVRELTVGANAVVVLVEYDRSPEAPYPVAVEEGYASMSTASYSQFAEGPWLTKKGMAWFWDQYLPDVTKRADIHVSPINASSEQLEGLPQTLIMVDENDVLRDEGEAFARKLAAAGVRVESVRYNGTIHDFMLLNPIAETPAVRGAVDQASDYLRKVFAVH